MDSDLNTPLLRRHSSSLGYPDQSNSPMRRAATVADNSSTLVTTETSQRVALLPENHKYPKDADEQYMHEALKWVDDDSNPKQILENIEKIKKRKDETNKTIYIDLTDEFDHVANERKGHEREKKLERMYAEFLEWKVFDNIFDCGDEMSLFEAEKGGNFIAFRLDREKSIKAMNLQDSKEYTFKENDDCPIELLKFIEQGQRLIIANRLFIYVWDFTSSTFLRFNILAKYIEKELNTEEICSKKANDFIVSFIHSKYYMLFTISKMIISVTLTANFDNIIVNSSETFSDILYFFPETKKDLLFAIISSKKDVFIIETRIASTLSRHDDSKIFGDCTYFSPPIVSYISKNIYVKFYVLESSELKIVGFSFPLESEHLDSTNLINPPLHPSQSVSRLTTVPTPINEKFSDACKVNRAWHANDEMIIVEFIKNKVGPFCSIYNSKLTREIKNFPSPFQGIIVENSIVFAYHEQILTILAIGSSKFKGTLPFSAEIQSVSTIANFIFVKTSIGTTCWKIQEDRVNHTVNKTLDENDYTRFVDLSHRVKQQLISVLCYGRDAKSLDFYLKNKRNFKGNEDIETMKIGKALKIKSTECMKVLFSYYVNLDKQEEKTDAMIHDIEENFAQILTCEASNLINFLDKLLTSEMVVGKLIYENTPSFAFYENKTDPLEELFFIHNASEVNEFEITSTVIQIPNIYGSNASVELTKALMECDKSIFTSILIKSYITMKWADLWFIVLGQTFIIWTNCLLVLYLILIDSDSLLALIGLLAINTFLVGCEILQCVNLGLSKYIGIQENKFFWNLGFMVALGFLFTQGIWLVIIYMIIQILSVYYEFGMKHIDIVIRSVPFLVFLGLFLVPDNYTYSFVVFLGYELVLYLKSILSREVERIGRNYVRIVALLVFVGYSCNNFYIVLFLSSIYVIDRVFDLGKLILYGRTPSIMLSLSETATLILVWLSFVLDSSVYTEYSLGVIILAHGILCYQTISISKSILSLRKYSAFYSIYLLIAYLESQNYLFLISFLLLSGFEWIYIKIFSMQQFKKDMSKLLFNWNSLDMCRIVITFIWIVLVLLSEKPSEKLTWFFASLNFIRGLTGFRAFSWTRFYVRLILSSVLDITSFFFIFVYMTVSFGVVNFTSGKVHGTLFEILWTIPYDMAFANYEHDNELDISYTSFLLASLLIIIVMLNLLISILSNSFQNCQISSSELDYMEMIETIFEGEILLFWRKEEVSKAYLAICDVPHENKEQNIVSGKLQEMYMIIRKLQKSMHVNQNQISIGIHKHDKELIEVRNDLREIKELIIRNK